MNKIIVPVDFSEHSEYALKTAALLAKKNDAELIVLHMLEMSDSGTFTGSDEFESQKAIFFIKLVEQRFEKFLEKDYLDNIKVTPMVKRFKVFSEVDEVVKEKAADLIIMGSHGVSGVKEFILGSNTERVVRNSDIPVLVVKNSISDINIDSIVFASDFTEEAVESYLKACKMFERTGAEMHFVYVNLPNDRFRNSDEIEKKLKDFFIKADGNLDNMKKVTIVSDYTIEKGVLNFANKIGADLISIPTHGRKGLRHFLEGSVGEDIANHATLPVMTFKI